MSDTLIFSRLTPLLTAPPARLRGRRFAERLAATEPVVEVLEAVETDFRQGEASMLSIINSALAQDSMTRPQLLSLRARMKRYSREVDTLANLVHALAEILRDSADRCPPPPSP